MPIGDIRPLKAGMRERYKALRRAMPPQDKQRADHAIAMRVRSLWQYRRCQTLLTYVSTDIEVDTREIIRQALADGKRVAVPRCVPGTRDMEFYRILSLNDLEPGAFGVLEPRHDPKFLLPGAPMACVWCLLCVMIGEDIVSDTARGIMIGIWPVSVDGWWGCATAAACGPRLPHGRFDRPVELIVTERFLRRTGDEKKRAEEHKDDKRKGTGA